MDISKTIVEQWIDFISSMYRGSGDANMRFVTASVLNYDVHLELIIPPVERSKLHDFSTIDVFHLICFGIDIFILTATCILTYV